MRARAETQRRRASRTRARRELSLGVDGGGTKTRAVVTDEEDRVIGEGKAGPSNPLRVGVVTAASAVRDAVERACSASRVRRTEIASALVGLAGVRREDLRERMHDALASLGVSSLEIVTDAEIALYGATGGEPGVVIIAGTGSNCCGVNARGQRHCASGWGPLVGDEGAGSWIARRALQSVAKATDGRGELTSLSEAACEYFNLATPNDLALAIYHPSMTNQIIAGFTRRVVEAARAGDDVAHEIVRDAGGELGEAATAVIRKLRMESERFQVGYVGGVFAAGEMILESLREKLSDVAPRAYLAPPKLAPAEAAARMAREGVNLAVAV